MTALPLILLGLGIALFMRSEPGSARLPGEPPWEAGKDPELGPSREAGPHAPPAAPAEAERASPEDRAIAADELGAMLVLDASRVQQAIEHIEPQIGVKLQGLRLYVAELGAMLPLTRQALAAAVAASPQRMMLASEAFGTAGLRQIAAQLETISRVHASRAFTADLVALVRDVAENGPPGEAAPPPEPAPAPGGPVSEPMVHPRPIVQIPPGIPGPPTAIDVTDRAIALDELSAMASTDLIQIGATIGHLLAAGLSATGLGAWATELGRMSAAMRAKFTAAFQSMDPEVISAPILNVGLSEAEWPQTFRQTWALHDLAVAGELSPKLIARIRRVAEAGTS